EREAEEDGTEKGQVELGEEEFLRGRIDQLHVARIWIERAIGVEQNIENLTGEEEANDQQQNDDDRAANKTLAQLGQMLKQRGLAAGEFVFDFGLALVVNLLG